MALFSGFIVLIFLLVVTQLNSIISFRDERDYIKMEIGRSMDEERRLFWEKELKRMYLRSIPIIGRFMK